MAGETKQLKKMTIVLPEDLHRRARAIAAMQSETLSAIVRDALERYVAQARDMADMQSVLDVREKVAAGTETVFNWDEVEEEFNTEPSVEEKKQLMRLSNQ